MTGNPGVGRGFSPLVTLQTWGGRDARPPKGGPVLAEVSEKHEPLLTLFCPLPLINIVRETA